MPVVKITERNAQTIAWMDKPTIHWDADLKGFGVWVWSATGRAYIVQTKRGGKSQRKTLGKVGEIKQEDARRQAVAFQSAVKADQDPRADEKAAKAAWVLEDAMNHYVGARAEARKLSASQITNCRRMWALHVPERWKDMKLTAITERMVVEQHKIVTDGTTDAKGRRKRGGSRVANYWLALMSVLFNTGLAKGHCATNPAGRGVQRNIENQKERRLLPEEIRRLWSYLEKHKNREAAICVQFLMLTGCRPGEAFIAKWVDFDPKTGVWTKYKTKQKKMHKVVLGEPVQALLNRLGTGARSEYVFPSPEDASLPRQDKLKSFWRAARKRCDIADVRLYDLRHTAASILAESGLGEIAIAAQLGHASLQTTKRYVHYSQDRLRSNSKVISDAIGAAMALPAPPVKPGFEST